MALLHSNLPEQGLFQVRCCFGAPTRRFPDTERCRAISRVDNGDVRLPRQSVANKSAKATLLLYIWVWTYSATMRRAMDD
ncbi:hypothetical protein THER5_2078 [Bifidobacterium thermacidophilum subsp. thermacidophilum]|uniref:Uncharacterized protein n=1 Tax=Bifidobacterium thermacidophilum subsp. thermacidophilum TaxID=79262 RepID=A0A087E1L6_9BIFI|nr:hypothetical protein THER5_2078 [Bifidobacterium thermacidophilum subsp. thermacidophilum]